MAKDKLWVKSFKRVTTKGVLLAVCKQWLWRSKLRNNNTAHTWTCRPPLAPLIMIHESSWHGLTRRGTARRVTPAMMLPAPRLALDAAAPDLARGAPPVERLLDLVLDGPLHHHFSVLHLAVSFVEKGEDDLWEQEWRKLNIEDWPLWFRLTFRITIH